MAKQTFLAVQAPAPVVASEDLIGDGWLDNVLKTREADLRAHQIALTYSKYAIYLDDLIHREKSVRALAAERRRVTTCNTNWFHYATWGTVTITRNIAHQRAPQRLDDVLPVALRRHLTPALIRERAANGQRVSRALAWSQRLIFITTAYTLQQFDASMRGKKSRKDPFELDDDTKEKINAKSSFKRDRSSDAEELPVGEERHLVPIGRAFEYYRQAANETDDGVRARLILGANVLLTAAEQDLAQLAVATVVDHIPQRFMNGVYRRTARAAEMWTGVPRQIVGLQLPIRLVGVHDLVDMIWSRLMTDQVLVMTLPTETLRLGRDIPPRDPAFPFYPRPLRRLDRQLDAPEKFSEGALREIADLVRSYDRSRASGRGSAARDWRLFSDRMNWAVALMRSRQQDETLFWPPYSTEDEGRIVSGELPFRAGDPSELEVQAPFEFLRGEPA